MTPDSPFVGVQKIADLLCVSRWTVLEWTRSVDPDAIPCYGKKPLLFKPAEVVAWFERTQARRGAVKVDAGRPILRRARSSGRAARRRHDARRRAPNGHSDGHQRAKPSKLGLAGTSATARARPVPSEGVNHDA